MLQSGDYDAAHSCYTRALELDRRNADAWVARGAAHANQKLYQKATSDFETALGENFIGFSATCMRHVPFSWDNLRK